MLQTISVCKGLLFACIVSQNSWSLEMEAVMILGISQGSNNEYRVLMQGLYNPPKRFIPVRSGDTNIRVFASEYDLCIMRFNVGLIRNLSSSNPKSSSIFQLSMT